MLELYITLHTLAYTTVDRARSRMVNDDRGQTAAEYLGIIVVVVAIVAAITGSGLGAKIFTAIGAQIDKIAK
jgi:pilus assembly protein Flp/PilA